MVESEFASATQFEKHASTNQPAIMGLPSDLPATTSIVEADAPVNASVLDFSFTSGLHSSASYDSLDINIDDTDDASDGLSMMARDVQSDGTTVMVKGQRSNIFQSECKIQDKVCKLFIDGGSFTNAISSDLVHALSLSTRRLPKPRYMQRMNQSSTLKITHKTRVKFSIGSYVDTVQPASGSGD